MKKSKTQKSIWEMSPEEYSAFLVKENLDFLASGGCPECLGAGDVLDAGMFSSRHRCEKCNGKGTIKL